MKFNENEAWTFRNFEYKYYFSFNFDHMYVLILNDYELSWIIMNSEEWKLSSDDQKLKLEHSGKFNFAVYEWQKK